MKNIINYAVVFTVFGSGFVLSRMPVDFYISYIILILFLIYYCLLNKEIVFNKYFLMILFFLSIFSVINVILENNMLSLFQKQFIGIGFSGFVYYLFLKYNDFDYNKIFQIYLKLAFLVACIGIFQEVAYLLDFKQGYDYRYFIPNFSILAGTDLGLVRICSILPEPAHFAAAIMPASFVSILNLVNYKNKPFHLSRIKSIIILISLVLSFSIMAFLGIIFIIILIIFNYKKLVYLFLGILVAIIFSLFVYTKSSDIKIKINDTISIVTENNFQLRNVNWSSFATLSNAIIAFRIFESNPFFGFGLGSYPITYDKHIGTLVNVNDPEMKFLNRTDANSLFLRLISETGLFGIIILFYFIFKNYVSKNKDRSLWILSNAIISLFFLNIIRQGHYFYNGLWMFIWMYYFISKAASKIEVKKIENIL